MNALKLLLKSPKTESFAKICHTEGNKYFKQKKYFDALQFYNKSLCHAKPNSVDLVNGFVGRSAVYFEMKQYADSLENIRLARTQSEFAGDTNVDDRESRCKEYLKHKGIGGIYDQHAQVPFLADCLELSENEKFGRYIKTNRDLRPGDVIATEEPLVIQLKLLNVFLYIRTVMSCSRNCHDLSAERNLEFDELIENELDWRVIKMIRIKDDSLAIAGSIDKLMELYYGEPKTLFDLDLNRLRANELRMTLLKCSISLIGGTNGETDNNLDVLKLMISSYHQRNRDFLCQYVGHMMNVCRKTQFSLNVFDERSGQFEKIGNCLLPFGGLLNHSCDPNIFWISAGEKFVFIVAKPIRAGEQLFICYRKTFLHEPLASRQKALVKQYGFKCDCSACKFDYAANTSNDDSLKLENFSDQNVQSIRAEIMKNWSDIESTFDKHSPHKTAEIIEKNKFLLEIVGSKFMYWNRGLH